MRQGSAKEAFGRCRITLGGQEEIDGLPCGVDRSIEEPLLAFHLDVRFIQAPTFVGGLQMPSTALVQLWTVDLNPAPDTTGADSQTSFDGHFTHLCHRNRIAKIPAYTPHDDVTRIMAPLERIGSGNRQVSRYQMGAASFRNGILYYDPSKYDTYLEQLGIKYPTVK